MLRGLAPEGTGCNHYTPSIHRTPPQHFLQTKREESFTCPCKSEGREVCIHSPTSQQCMSLPVCFAVQQLPEPQWQGSRNREAGPTAATGPSLSTNLPCSPAMLPTQGGQNRGNRQRGRRLFALLVMTGSLVIRGTQQPPQGRAVRLGEPEGTTTTTSAPPPP